MMLRSVIFIAIPALLSSACISEPDPGGGPCTPDGACPGGQVCSPDDGVCLPSGTRVLATAFAPVTTNNDIDLLFVIDNSESMAEEQALLAAGFPRMIEALDALGGDRPNLHIGVISTDLGADPRISKCNASDEGALQRTPAADCSLPEGFLDGTFIRDVVAPDGAGRLRNYEGALSEVFSCIARLGTEGCGFEMPLESMRRALVNNPGFLRPDALLAVVFITDEDDCSTRDYGMFDITNTSLDSALGPLSSFRCFEFGVRCEPDEPRTLGSKTQCVPRKQSPYMFDVDEYVAFLQSLKGNPAKIFVAGIIGSSQSVVVSTQTSTTGEPRLRLDPSCTAASGEAEPAIRMEAFLRQFPGQNLVATICRDSLSDAMNAIASRVARQAQGTCLPAWVRDAEPGTDGVQHRCDVTLRAAGSEAALPACSNAADPASSLVLPCYVIHEDQGQCDGPDARLSISVYGRVPPAAGAEVAVHCPLA